MNYREYVDYYYSLVFSLISTREDVYSNKSLIQDIIKKIISNSWLNRDLIYMSEYSRVLEFLKVIRIFYFEKIIHTSNEIPQLNTGYCRLFKQNKKAIKSSNRERRDILQMIENYTDTIQETDENIQELCSAGEDKILYGTETRKLSQLKCEISRKIMLLENREGHHERLVRVDKSIRVAQLKSKLFGRTMEFSIDKMKKIIKSDDVIHHIYEFIGREFMTIVRHNIICTKYTKEQNALELSKWRMSDLHEYCNHIYVRYNLRFSHDVSTTFIRLSHISKLKKENLIEYLIDNFQHTFEFIRDIYILTPAVVKMIKNQRSTAAATRRAMRATAAATTQPPVSTI